MALSDTERRRKNYSRGTARWSAKLTEDQVRAIRRRRAEGEKLVVLAAEFRLADSTIARIAKGKRWRHVEP